MDVVAELIDLAAERHVAAIDYRKPTLPKSTRRTIEPYALLDGEACCVRAWQVDPESPGGMCWRSFRVDRIEHVEDGGRTFIPRRTITLSLGLVEPQRREKRKSGLAFGVAVAVELPPATMKDYRVFIEDCMMDGKLTQNEIDGAYCRGQGLSEEQRRCVHAAVMADALFEAAMDGEITDDESQFIRQLNGFLKTLGWGP